MSAIGRKQNVRFAMAGPHFRPSIQDAVERPLSPHVLRIADDLLSTQSRH